MMDAAKQSRAAWARLIKKVYDGDPLISPLRPQRG